MKLEEDEVEEVFFDEMDEDEEIIGRSFMSIDSTKSPMTVKERDLLTSFKIPSSS